MTQPAPAPPPPTQGVALDTSDAKKQPPAPPEPRPERRMSDAARRLLESAPDHKLDRVLWLTIVRSEELAKLKKLCPWPNIQPFSPHITIARIGKPHDFRIHKKKIMKLLKNVSFDIPVDRIRFFAEIECEKQTPLRDFPLIQSSST